MLINHTKYSNSDGIREAKNVVKMAIFSIVMRDTYQKCSVQSISFGYPSAGDR